MKKFEFLSIRTNLTFWFLILALSPLFIGMVITYRESSSEFEVNTLEKLTAIRNLKVGQVETWIAERMGDLNTISMNRDLMAFNESPHRQNKSGNDLKNNIRDILINYQKGFLIYKEILIINAKTGVVEISTNTLEEGQDKSNDSYFSEPLNTNKAYIKDLYYSTVLGENTMAISVPFHSSMKADAEIIGIVVARIDLKSSLYHLLLNRIGLGITGETFIVNKDAIALSELRYEKDAPLRFKIKAEPAVNAAQGKTGIVKSLDYRGEKVLAAYTYIPETGWGFICKQDWNELNGPSIALGRLLLLLLLASGLIVVTIVYFVSRRISSPIIELFNDSNKIAGGDYSTRNSVKAKNELGKLGAAINVMVERIESKASIQKGVAAISEALIGHATHGQFTIRILKQLLKVTGADMCVFYTLSKSEAEFEPVDSIGANKNLLQSFVAEKPEGELGNALVSEKIHHIKNLPGDTIFRYKTSAGEIVPREIVTIPVKNNNEKVIALISLVSIRHFTTEAIEVLHQSWYVINTSYTSLVSGEQTAIMAGNLLITNQKLEVQSEELQLQAEELQQQASELKKGSDELQMQNQELEMQRIQVEEATRLKSEFLSNMSHELRTPLNSINALSHVLIRQAKHKLSAEENEYLEVVERNGKRLLSLINDILDLSKIEAGKMELEPKALSLSALVSLVADNIQPLATQKNITMKIKMPDEPVEIETDESRLYQVLVNIIGNAVKFTDKGGVEISVYSDAEAAYVQVQDTGIGISKDAIPFIFDEFRQADGSTTRSYEGTGLGLAIARKSVQSLHGKITVESTTGMGSLFIVSLPVKWEGRFEVETFAMPQKQEPDLHKKTILVVDDDPKIVQQISASLDDSGYHTIGTTSGKEALKLAETYKPYAITLDIVMPDMDGLEVLQNLKNNPETFNIPVIVISISNDKQTCFALGAVGYIAKPVNRQVLVREIRKLDANSAMVMIVDDNPIDRKQIHDILQQENLYGIQAESGERCLELLQINQPDVLVLDLMMPGMDGFQVLDEIRKRPETLDLPVIVVTAKDITQDDRKLLSGKVAAVLTKSTVAPEQIYEEIKRILEQLDTKKHVFRKPGIQNSIKRVLIIDDNDVAVIQVKKILEKEHIAVDVAGNGAQALGYVKHNIPDGIILDLMMPGMDGFELLEIIRSTEETRNLPILILTASNLTKKDLSRLSANNVQLLIQKGDVNAHELLTKVKTMLGIEPSPEVNTNTGIVFQAPEIQGTPRISQSDENKLKILIVEDNADNRLTVRAILGDRYSIIEASDGEEGVQKTFSEMPDLVLLDISLPKMNGYEVIKLLRNNEKTKSIPVIAITAKAMKYNRDEIMAAGFDEYVAKPIDQEDLLSKIKRLL